MARVRTIDQAYLEIKAADPDSSVSKNYIRQLVLDGVVPYRKAGKRYLLNFDFLLSYLAGDIEPLQTMYNHG